MASNIDPTKPGSGNAYTAGVRENFSAAKAEIEALQAEDAELHVEIATKVASVDGQTGVVDLSASYEHKRKHNLTATTDPTVDDDSSAGYEPLSKWVNVTTGEIYTCIAATLGAANWQSITLTIDELGALALLDSASELPITDLNEHFAAENVEDALQEEAAARKAHEGNQDNPHVVTAAQVGADAAGTAATAVSTHEAAIDPHPQYAAETTTTVGALIAAAEEKTEPADADMLGLMDSAASNVLKKFSWANLKARLKTYFDTLYSLASHSHDGTYAPAANGVTNGNSHDHAGGDGAQIAYSSLSGLPTLGTAAAKDVGTSGDSIPLNNTANTFSAQQSVTVTSADPAFTATQNGAGPVIVAKFADVAGSNGPRRVAWSLGANPDINNPSLAYILLARKYAGTNLAPTGFFGELRINRGTTTVSSNTTSYLCNIRQNQAAETISLVHTFRTSTASTFNFETCYATVDGVEYIALRRVSAASIVISVYLDGYVWSDGDATLPKMVMDSAVTAATTISAPESLVLYNGLGTAVIAGGAAETPTRSTVASGSTINLTISTSNLLYDNASTAAALTVNLPPTDLTTGQRITIATRSEITALTVGGGTIYGAPTTLPAGGFCSFIYSADAAAWFRRA